ncbi:hypothetical protein HNQ34_003324 [Anoxybacillus tepidamans]|uniref:Type II toxin-antitoxin system RelE/ParE family toxin n=1 Tax=Anoxybacteroides tepidamans TaxID=265948 RepID=A0A7W8MY17_9BACL|nr:type II toxin-antitoxin system RelE/ParE family toxin [Anoxybacillus tepidamans]MBB5326205.1 hypothetical protein [Anoxybacillus tepidamans]
MDFVVLLEQFPLEKGFYELSICIEKAIQLIRKDPEAGAPCRYPPLIGWMKYKFHSKLRPPHGQKADMRIVYRINPQLKLIDILCIGKRLPKEMEDIYNKAYIRDQEW